MCYCYKPCSTDVSVETSDVDIKEKVQHLKKELTIHKKNTTCMLIIMLVVDFWKTSTVLSDRVIKQRYCFIYVTVSLNVL